jgi:hypothetical protein
MPAEGLGLRHFLDGGDGIELVKAQLGEFDAIKGKLPIWRVDIEPHDRLHRVVRAGRGFAEIFFDRLGFWQFERIRARRGSRKLRMQQ